MDNRTRIDQIISIADRFKRRIFVDVRFVRTSQLNAAGLLVDDLEQQLPSDSDADKPRGIHSGKHQLSSSFIHSFIPAISIAPLQVLYYSEALPTTARILYRSFTPKRTGNCR